MGCSSVKVPIIDWVRFILLEYLRLPEESHGCCVVLFCYLGSGLLAGLICCLVVVVPFHSVLDRRWLTLSTVLTSIASIRILSSQYAPARQWRTDAYRRVFAMLGYGFHRLNPAIFRIARWLGRFSQWILPMLVGIFQGLWHASGIRDRTRVLWVTHLLQSDS